ncbi:MAG: OmpA family protein [Bacteroidia bacterium]|nr:OmpA family protein [Bacteroidia bacterium]
MKISQFLLCLALSSTAIAQDANLAFNGSFENTHCKIHSLGAFANADSISSSNNTSVDLFGKDARSHDLEAGENYMGIQQPKTGNNYTGITAFYADETGMFFTRPGYQKYSEYIQVPLSHPLQEGDVYKVSFNLSLAEKSAYAISGLGVYFTNEKIDVQNNAFLKVTPHLASADIMSNTDWIEISGDYVASGGERYLTIGCFPDLMVAEKIIPPFTNNSRKAYYYIDDIYVGPAPEPNNEALTMILYGSCYQLKDFNYGTDQYVIPASAEKELGLLVRFLKTYPYINVYVDGYTDKTGTDKHNDQLSKNRAAAVKDFLVQKGIKESRIRSRGYGDRNPIDSENTSSAANRRVEITICEFDNEYQSSVQNSN